MNSAGPSALPHRRQRDPLYQPLVRDKDTWEIRLLSLAPSESLSDEIHCTLSTHHGTVFLQYESLSYVWGDPTVVRPVWVNGIRRQITQNLHGALRRLRSRDTPRILWVDAICINQDDDEEKGHQVDLMGWIYAQSVRTIVWLGDVPDRDLGSAIALFNWINGKDPAPLLRRPRSTLEGIERCIELTFASSWFERGWTAQEGVLARELVFMLGPATASFRDMHRAEEIARGDPPKRVWPILEGLRTHIRLMLCALRARDSTTCRGVHDIYRVKLQREASNWTRHYALESSPDLSTPPVFGPSR